MTKTEREHYTAYRLANMIDAKLRSSLSDGGEWLEQVARCWIDYDRPEAIEYGTDMIDAMYQSADSAVPIYTGHRWQVFTDLQGWEFSEEIAEELGPLPSDMTEAIAWILCTLAHRLICALEAERDEDEDGEQ